MSKTVEHDLPEALGVLKDIKKSSEECLQNFKALVSKVKEGPSVKEGISFLDVKNQLMASYMSNLGLLMSKKLCGQPIHGHDGIDRLVELRTVLEKMRPIEHKLKYQINKVISIFKERTSDPSDPRRFKANFDDMAKEPGEDSSGDEKKEKDQEMSKLYVAPKLAPAHYDDDETAEDRLRKTSEIKRRKSLSSQMLKDMREQYTDAPVEITDNFDLHRFKENKQEKERIEYEERNFYRISLSKKEESARRRMGTMSALGVVADFGGGGGYGDDQDGPPSKKKKSGGRGKSKTKYSKKTNSKGKRRKK